MKAILFDGDLKFVEHHPPPEPARDEALIRVRLAGICNTDLEITRGYMGFRGILGHEFVGIVERVNGPQQEWVGKRVVGEINCGCGACEYCLRGAKNHCPQRTVLGIAGREGAFAEHITLPVANLWEVPENLLDEEAVFTEPLAATLEIPEEVHIRPTDRLIVLGDGKLGLLASLGLRLTQADITLVGKHENKMKIARDHDIRVVFLRDLKMTKVYDVVVEATGSPEGFGAALKLVRPRGRIVLKSTVADKKEIDLAPIVIDEVQVIGSRCGPFGPALNMLSKRLVDVSPLITGIFPVDRAEEAFEKTKDKKAVNWNSDIRIKKNRKFSKKF
ncbi:MAG: alcohol dehydrogenase [Deltaproteobacteria bacterium]|nr:MAG: alcohol dehydrogenase [Deltaproteobacteria bacterium]